MVVHCVRDYQDDLVTRKVVIQQVEEEYTLEVMISPPIGCELSARLYELQQSIFRHIEKYAGLSIREVNITVGLFYKPQDLREGQALPNAP